MVGISEKVLKRTNQPFLEQRQVRRVDGRAENLGNKWKYCFLKHELKKILTWKIIVAMQTQFDWFMMRSSLMTLVKISFGGNKSRKICPNTRPKTSASSIVAVRILVNKISIFSVDCIMISGSSCTIPFDFSVFSSCSKEPV